MKRHFSILFILVFFGFVTPNQETILVDVSTLNTTFDFEIRYATTNNFVGEAVYDCAKCILLPNVAEALVKANMYFCKKGYRIKFYDCYRPLDVQKKLWEKVPNPAYVANPYDGASIHNRGAAVDITLVTLEGCFVDMGTDYDFFGRKAHIDNFDHSEEVLANRKTLFEGMKLFGFSPIRTEWWHFSYKKNSGPVLNEPLPCN